VIGAATSHPLRAHSVKLMFYTLPTVPVTMHAPQALYMQERNPFNSIHKPFTQRQPSATRAGVASNHDIRNRKRRLGFLKRTGTLDPIIAGLIHILPPLLPFEPYCPLSSYWMFTKQTMGAFSKLKEEFSLA